MKKQKTMKQILLILVFIMITGSANAAIAPPKPLEPIPSKDQLIWHETDLTLFVHFGVNTFVGCC